MSAIPVTATTPQACRLLTLLEDIRGVVSRTFKGQYWIIAEVMKCTQSSRGHYYFELGDMKDGQVVAQIRATLWAGENTRRILSIFKNVTGSDIKEGMELMLLVSVQFHPVYGLQLIISNINADHTLGSIERAKQMCLKRLEEEGILDLNKRLSLSPFPLRIAVITSHSAAGWGDFSRQIEQSLVGKLFQLDIYASTMQGKETTRSVINALHQIYAKGEEQYDAVLVLRGGGSRLDLSAFDDYDLCSALAQFPLPVLTGIGHERDESVADLVAHTRVKTPTALAEYLIRRVHDNLTRLFTSEERVKRGLSQLLEEGGRLLREESHRLSHALLRSTQRESSHLSSLDLRLATSLGRRKDGMKTSLVLLSQRMENLLGKLITDQSTRLQEHPIRLERLTRSLINDQTHTIYRQVYRLDGHTSKLLSNALFGVERLRDRLLQNLSPIVSEGEYKIKVLESRLKASDPRQIMQRGFVPLLREGTQVHSIEELHPNDTIQLLLVDGEATGRITSLTHYQHQDDE